MIIGGKTQGFELSVESLSENSWEVLNSSLKYGNTQHCLAYTEDMALPLMIGGVDNQEISEFVFYFDALSGSWDLQSRNILLFKNLVIVCFFYIGVYSLFH